MISKYNSSEIFSDKRIKMKKKVIVTMLLASSLSLMLIGCGGNDSNSTDNKAFKVALLGCEPIWKGQDKNDTIASINEHKVDFTLFNGDTKDGGSECSDYAIGERPMAYFNRLDNSVSYSVGDNEWTDCHRTSNGSYTPTERLSYIRSVFFDKSTTQGNNAFAVERQGASGQEYSENSRFVKNGVMFVALHIPGSNNNFVSTDHLCTKKSTRTQAECDLQTAEYVARNAKNLEWLKSSFEQAKTDKLAGIVVSIQADIYFPFEMSDGEYQDTFLTQLDPATNGYADFFHELIAQTHAFDGQVLLYHSDSHFFKLDKAMFDDSGAITSNFTRVENFGDAEQSWIEMSVDPDSKNVFSFQPVILKALTKPAN